MTLNAGSEKTDDNTETMKGVFEEEQISVTIKMSVWSL